MLQVARRARVAGIATRAAVRRVRATAAAVQPSGRRARYSGYLGALAHEREHAVAHGCFVHVTKALAPRSKSQLHTLRLFQHKKLRAERLPLFYRLSLCT